MKLVGESIVSESELIDGKVVGRSHRTFRFYGKPSDLDELWKWISSRCQGACWRKGKNFFNDPGDHAAETFCFRAAKDAMLVKLTWG